MTFGIVVLLTLLAQSASASAPNDTESAISKFAVEYFRAFGDTATYEQFFDQSADFLDVGDGQFQKWAEHQATIRQFFSRADGILADWLAPPQIVVLAPDAGIFAGRARFTFSLPDGRKMSRSSAVSYVVRKNRDGWKIVHAHSSELPKPGPPQ